MANASLNLNFNITIKVLDKYGHILETRHVHNKATRSLVNGITQFLQGAFNPSEFNDPYEKYSNPEQVIINNALSAKRFIPSCTGMGICGVTINDDHELSIDESQQIRPHFYESNLQIELTDIPRVKFKRARAVVGADQNNTESLVLTTVLPKGYLVVEYEDGHVKHDENGRIIYRDTYFNYYGINGDDPTPVNAMIITEIGLFSNTESDKGLMLARVLLDGELSDDPVKAKRGVMKDPDYQYNPLIQTKDTSVVIEWKVGIISIGTNDEFGVISDQDPDIPIEDATDVEPYTGPYDVESYTDYTDYLPTTDKVLSQNVVVHPITTRSTATAHSEGNTLIIGNSHNE